jgi:hypothetical protein
MWGDVVALAFVVADVSVSRGRIGRAQRRAADHLEVKALGRELVELRACFRDDQPTELDDLVVPAIVILGSVFLTPSSDWWYGQVSRSRGIGELLVLGRLRGGMSVGATRYRFPD